MTTEGFITLSNPQALDLAVYNRVWWDPGHQHFVLMHDDFSFQTLSMDSKGGQGSVYEAQRSSGKFTEWSKKIQVPLRSPKGPKHPKPVLAKLSLDCKLIAVQLSDTIIIVHDLEKKYTWTVECKGPGNKILKGGYVWSDHGGNSQDLIVVTHRGAEFYKISSKRNQCKLSRSLAYQTKSWWYASESRLLLLGTGLIGHEMRGWFLKTEASDIPRLELPPPDKVPKFMLPASVGGRPHDVALVCLYFTMYAAVIDPPAAVIRLFRISKDGTALTHSLNLYECKGDCEISVVDNILCVHARQTRVTLMFDIKAPPRGTNNVQGGAMAPVHTMDPLVGACGLTFGADVAAPTDQREAVDATSRATGGKIADEFYTKWRLLWSQHAMDTTTSQLPTVWEVQLNLARLVQAMPNPTQSLPFLQRRGIIANYRLVPTLPTISHFCSSHLAAVVLLKRVAEVIQDKSSKRSELALLFRMLNIPYRDIYSREKAKQSQAESLTGSRRSSNPAVTSLDNDQDLARLPGGGGGMLNTDMSRRASLQQYGTQTKLELLCSLPDGVYEHCKADAHCFVDSSRLVTAMAAMEAARATTTTAATTTTPLPAPGATSSGPATPPGPPMGGRAILRPAMRAPTGLLIVCQSDMFKFVFKPLANGITDDGTYLINALVEFLVELRRCKLPCIPEIPCLVVDLLTLGDGDQVPHRAVGELVQFLQYKVIPDMAEVAQRLVQVVASGKVRKSDVDILVQLATDMYWRLDLAPLGVEALLQSNLVLQAMHFATRAKDKPRDRLGLTEMVARRLPARAFFEATVESSQHLDPPSRKSLFVSLFTFLKEWDPISIQLDPATERSKLAAEVQFPAGFLPPDQAAYLSRLFGVPVGGGGSSSSGGHSMTMTGAVASN